MHIYGIRGVAYQWFVSYLSNRSQFVDLEGTESSYRNIEYGVAQGSILGPLLYLIYVNDINYSCDANILSFADDTTVYVSNNNVKKLYEEANLEINKLYEWFCSNGLSLNINKTKYMVMRPKSKVENLKELEMSIY